MSEPLISASPIVVDISKSSSLKGTRLRCLGRIPKTYSPGLSVFRMNLKGSVALVLK